MEIILLLIGAIVGGLISWGITHQYYKKSSKEQKELIYGQEELKSKSDEILTYQEDKVLSDLEVSIQNCLYSLNYIELKVKKYPKLKNLTFPILNIVLTNSGKNPIKDIKIFFEYFSPLSMQYTLDLYTDSNKLSAGQVIKYSSAPPMDSKDLKLFRLKMRVEWVDVQTQKKDMSEYHFELSNNSGKLLYSPLNGTLDFHKETIFDKSDYELIAPKDFAFHRNDFINENFK